MIFSSVGLLVFVWNHAIADNKAIFPTDPPKNLLLQINATVLGKGLGKWTLTTDPGYRIKLACKLEQDLDCNVEELLVSIEGDPDLLGAQRYCWTSEKSYIEVLSKHHFMTVGFITVPASPDYKKRFYCKNTTVVPVTNAACSCGNYQAGEAMLAALYAKTPVAGKTVMNMVCASTIIDNRHVITTAVCAGDYYGTNNVLFVIVGPHYANPLPENSYAVDKVFVHKLYDYETSMKKYMDMQNYAYYNIAVVRTKLVIEFNVYVSAPCLPYKYSNFDWDLAEETDIYFRLFHNYSIPHFLNAHILNENECFWAAGVETDGRPQHPWMQLCSHIQLAEDDKYYVNFASGGPIMYMEELTGLQYIIGLVTPVEFTSKESVLRNVKIMPFLKWIKDITSEANNDYQYCKM